MTFPRVSRHGRHFANVGDGIIYLDLVVARTVVSNDGKKFSTKDKMEKKYSTASIEVCDIKIYH